ncbi:MAG TPA: hypothetical protein VHA10_02165 [Hypericibacter adhaerens]|uniref:hypothetical protein n=1 Tax=Hypericibacter adhaerens TaxID=2602016 RepID=UPI002CBDC859|nr:hypothetical protein [Hypericibacter adhaerens]HWA41985.1 hypothetical protein [Hypericibacter adhaerens]
MGIGKRTAARSGAKGLAVILALSVAASDACAGESVDFGLGACPQVTGNLVIDRPDQTITMHLTTWTDRADSSHIQLVARSDWVEIVSDRNGGYRTEARMLFEQTLLADMQGYPVQSSIHMLKDVEVVRASSGGKPLTPSQTEDLRSALSKVMTNETGDMSQASGTGLWPHLLKDGIEEGKLYRATQLDLVLIYLNGLRAGALSKPPSQRTDEEAAAAAAADPAELRRLAISFCRSSPLEYPCLMQSRYQVTKSERAGRWDIVTNSTILPTGATPLRVRTEVEIDQRLCVYKMHAENLSEGDAAKAVFRAILFEPD